MENLVVSMELVQKTIFRGNKTFSLTESGKVKVKYDSIGKGSTNSFDVSDLDKDFESHKQIPYNNLFFMTLSLMFMTALVWEGIEKQNDNILWLNIIFFIPFAMNFFAFFRKKSNLVVVKYIRDGSMAFAMDNNSPTPEEFDKFKSALKVQINKSRGMQALSSEEKLGVYERYLAFLVDEGVILPEEAESIYQRAKDNIKPKKADVYVLPS